MKITAIVMASGMSKRMGVNKLRMKIKNKSIYEYVLDTIKKYNFNEVIVVAKDDDILISAERLGFVGVKNTKYSLGQSESIKAGLEKAKDCDGFMFFVADQPFIRLETIEKLCHEFAHYKANIILPYYNGVRGNPVIFPYDLKEQLISLHNDEGGKVVINNNVDKVMGIDILTKDEFMDIDTIEEYEKVKNMF